MLSPFPPHSRCAHERAAALGVFVVVVGVGVVAVAVVVSLGVDTVDTGGACYHPYDGRFCVVARAHRVAGDRYSFADITALVTIDFARRARLTLPEGAEHIARWYGIVDERSYG